MLKETWNKLSRTGLRDNEGVFGHREVIFLNKILIVSQIAVALIIPLEVIINGWELVPVEIALIILVCIPLIFQRFRLFWLARLLSFVLGNAFILIAGVLVGKGVHNHLAMISLMLFGMIIFKTRRDRILILFASLLFYLALHYLRDNIPPSYNITEANKEKFSHIFYILALLLTFFLGFYSLDINSQFEKLIIEQKENLAHKNKEITDSINYAQRIQKAKLPPKEDIYSSLPGCFVLYKPKDIVSGDFYFFQEKGQEIFLAAADCTGHGVPGALMSMVGSEQLTKAVLQGNSISQILSLLNQGIKSSLRQSDTSDSTRDGMDIALCSIRRSGNLVTFAGANRPLWIIKNGSQVIEEIKGTKNAIGGLTNNDTHFECREMNLQEGDTFYIFTDGYADQFSGTGGKKLMTKRFKEILQSIQDKTMRQQEEYLDRFIEDWKGEAEQVDDILIIGVRV